MNRSFHALKEFCGLILCGENIPVYEHCKNYIENASDEFGGIPDVLYILSGNDEDSEDSFENAESADNPLVKPQSYLISSDAGAPELGDFFWFIDNLKAARGLDFTIRKERFSENTSLIEWLAELSAQLKDLYILNFDGAGDDYHFTILNKADCERAIELFQKMTAHVKGYDYETTIITPDFQG